VFRRQFETIAEHKCRKCQEKTTYLITAIQDQANDMPHGVLRVASYEETLEALEDCFGDQHLPTMYHRALPMKRPRKSIPYDRYGLFYQVARSLFHSQSRGFDSGRSTCVALASVYRGSYIVTRAI
jgi:hypothetical protein